ncbi:MAG TPA: DUF2059 domain-containing protein [Candidatus Angelobacter sp.]|nr:DUF2059 domain-containing protein [Candidatus Angelobacter sp.]
MLRAASLLLVVMAVSPAIGQQSVAEAAAQSRAAADAKRAAAAPPTREQVLKLFDLLQITKTMDAVVNATKQQSMEIAEQMVHDKMPEANAEQKKKFREMMDDVMRESLGPAAIQEMLEATVPVYQRHMTKADLDAMMVFYSSPVGQKILHEQPAMVEESMEASAEIQQRIARTMFQKIDERVAKMAEAEKDSAKKP